ncbi:winged helix-turn-helix domain-containing protein [Thiomonas bhubaneswarensis]|uniref:winged helix-turn-helix domain-containing protein n=1 Tax=Thiomonas bhubaneswarensis TaxID=339866 RepID=UPI0006E321B5|nr:winged helix-turn-helix domain-containing protein [Thiomonas bhubaneswarensis]
MNPPVKHAVLRLHFSSAQAPCLDSNSQPVATDEALQRLQTGDAWAALAASGEDVGALTNWLMRLRQRVGGRLPGVIVFLPDCASPGAMAALKAGADALLPLDSPPALIRIQLARLRERITPQPEGGLRLDPGLELDSQTRSLRIGDQHLPLPTQQFHLLWTLGARPGEVLSTQELRLAMDVPARARADTVHTAVARLRRHLRPHALDQRVQTVHGAGYRWAAAAEPTDDSATT